MTASMEAASGAFLPLPHWMNVQERPSGVAEGGAAARGEVEEVQLLLLLSPWLGHPPRFPPLLVAAAGSAGSAALLPAPADVVTPVGSAGSVGSAVTETAHVDAHPDPVAGSAPPSPAVARTADPAVATVVAVVATVAAAVARTAVGSVAGSAGVAGPSRWARAGWRPAAVAAAHASGLEGAS